MKEILHHNTKMDIAHVYLFGFVYGILSWLFTINLLELVTERVKDKKVKATIYGVGVLLVIGILYSLGQFIIR